VSAKERLGMIALYFLVMDDDDLRPDAAHERRWAGHRVPYKTPSWTSR
jgi:hypothetical protein